MNKYTTSGFRPVRAETMKEAAEIFAGRAARKAFGKKGYVRICNLESYSQDNTLGEYNAFIGYRTGQGETTGVNERFTVLLLED